MYRNVNCHVMSCRFACHAMFEILIHVIQFALPKCSACMQSLLVVCTSKDSYGALSPRAFKQMSRMGIIVFKGVLNQF